VSAEDPASTFDHHSADFAADPVACFRTLREQCPVAWASAHDGYWVLTRYDDIARVTRDVDRFSSARPTDDAPETSLAIPGIPIPLLAPVELDPPRFRDYRRILDPILAPQAVEPLKPAMARWSARAVDDVIERGSCDLVADVASAVPAGFTLEWLGFPLEWSARYAETFHNEVAFPPSSPEFAVAVEADKQIKAEIRALVVSRRREPSDDVVSYIVRQDAEGGPISEDMAVSMVSLLLRGGIDTTTSLAGQVFMLLNDRLDARAALVDDPIALKHATEEFLRFVAPVTSLARVVRDDVVVGDRSFRAGDRVLLPLLAANRDPAQFDDPDVLDLARNPNRHQAFGMGIHRCVGSHLARGMFQAVLVAVLRRMPDYRIDESTAAAYPYQGGNTGWATLPASFTPGQRLGP
jgi:cytochrome P450